jgi:ATP synthase protein I
MTQQGAASSPFRRRDVRESLKRDLDRLTRREPGDSSFWRSLSVIGSVGWPIVAATVGGALAGRWMHARWNTGVGLTALLVAVGAVVGMVIVWQLIQPRQP